MFFVMNSIMSRRSAARILEGAFMNQPQDCDYCKEQIHCRNLYVAMKILEEELRFADREDLWEDYHQLKQDIAESKFNYPEGSSLCSLADSSEAARALVARADIILRELRRTVSISPA